MTNTTLQNRKPLLIGAAVCAVAAVAVGVWLAKHPAKEPLYGMMQAKTVDVAAKVAILDGNDLSQREGSRQAAGIDAHFESFARLCVLYDHVFVYVAGNVGRGNATFDDDFALGIDVVDREDRVFEVECLLEVGNRHRLGPCRILADDKLVGRYGVELGATGHRKAECCQQRPCIFIVSHNYIYFLVGCIGFRTLKRR